jgi:hypothetical protein
MDEMVKTVLWSAPLSAVIISGILWLLKSWIAVRLKNSIQHEYDKDIERHKAALKAQFDVELEVRKSALKAHDDTELEIHKAYMQQRFHIMKSQFDMEFNSFQSVWTSMGVLVDATARLINSFLSSYSFEKGQKELEKYAKIADTAFFEAQSVVRGSSPFMPEEINKNANSLAVKCKEEIDLFFYLLGGAYKSEDFGMEKATKETEASRKSLNLAYHDLADMIRERLAFLSATKNMGDQLGEIEKIVSEAVKDLRLALTEKGLEA